MWQDDPKFEEHALEGVRAGDGGWEISFDGCCITWCENTECSVAPLVGETVRIIGSGLGSPVRGIVIGGRCYRYRTEEQETERHAQWCRDQEAKRQAQFEATRLYRDAEIAKLPEPLRQRIERFQRTTPNWRRDHEEYELFCCKEAIKIAEALKTGEAIAAFAKANLEEQKALVPAAAYDEHSGNTFGASCRIAYDLVARPHQTEKTHGSLCALVGCQDFGCWAAYEARNG